VSFAWYAQLSCCKIRQAALEGAKKLLEGPLDIELSGRTLIRELTRGSALSAHFLVSRETMF
jgi:hypothetical protein